MTYTIEELQQATQTVKDLYRCAKSDPYIVLSNNQWGALETACNVMDEFVGVMEDNGETEWEMHDTI